MPVITRAATAAGRALYDSERTAPAWKDLTPASRQHWIARAMRIVAAYETAVAKAGTDRRKAG